MVQQHSFICYLARLTLSCKIHLSPHLSDFLWATKSHDSSLCTWCRKMCNCIFFFYPPCLIVLWFLLRLLLRIMISAFISKRDYIVILSIWLYDLPTLPVSWEFVVIVLTLFMLRGKRQDFVGKRIEFCVSVSLLLWLLSFMLCAHNFEHCYFFLPSMLCVMMILRHLESYLKLLYCLFGALPDKYQPLKTSLDKISSKLSVKPSIAYHIDLSKSEGRMLGC